MNTALTMIRSGGPAASVKRGGEADDRAAAHRALMSRPSVAFGAFETITNAWRLSVEQRMALLGVKGRTRYSRWRAEPEGVRLEHHHAERIARVIEIADHLCAVHPNDRTGAERWPTQANSGPEYGAMALG